MKSAFSFARTPRLVFGTGSIARLPELVSQFGTRILLVTGVRALQSSGHWQDLVGGLQRVGVILEHIPVSSEPSPHLVDEAVAALRPKGVQVVVAVGGGSIIDAGKAISAMLPEHESVVAFLEGVGDPARHRGRKVPFVAVPTTTGTGSEATKNAVLTLRGHGGFKKSLRHDHFVPEVALVDPLLTRACPPELTAACGMDAFTQLLESYVGTGASPLTDLLVVDGMRRVRDCLHRAVHHGLAEAQAREEMAYAALLSGLALANAGLGVVHGLAAPLGTLAPIPQGAACATLVAAATKKNVLCLQQRQDEQSKAALAKYAHVGALSTGQSGSLGEQCQRLVDILSQWTEEFRMPHLGEFGPKRAQLQCVAQQGENKNNPVQLTEEQRFQLLAERL